MRTINKQPKKAGLIFTVFQDQNNEANKKAHDDMLKSLIHHGIAFKIVEGGYTNKDGLFNTELGYYVQPNENYTYTELKQFVKSQCLNANQESYLELNENRNATLCFLDGETLGIGVFTSVNENEALNSNAYTYDPKNETYFICK